MNQKDDNVKKVLLFLLLVMGSTILAHSMTARSEISMMIYDSYNLREAEKCVALLDVYSEINRYYSLENVAKAQALSKDVSQVYRLIIQYKQRYYSEEKAVEKTAFSYSYFRANAISAINFFVRSNTENGLIPSPEYVFSKPIDFHGETKSVNERLTYCASHIKSKLGYIIGEFN